MIILLAKLAFLLTGLYATGEPGPQILIVFLISVAISALLQYLKSSKATAVGLCFYAIICFILPLGIYFFPVLTIDLSLSQNHKKYYPLLLIPALAAWQGGFIIWYILITALALLIGYLLKQNSDLAVAYNALQDSHTEQSSLLRHKNNELTDSQEKVASLATLQERTRIARDIHDNIGHILIRGILLVGVLKTTNKEDKLTESITSIEGTLKEAMDSIRKAVHDWKDEAIDLHESVEKLRFTTTLDVDLQYDASDEMPTDIKLCFLMVIKEALTNSSKHSNATAMKITLQEHPSMYQLLIKDNGSGGNDGKLKSGMGLSNIEERVTALKGTSSFENQNGFRIFISIPKDTK